MQRNWRERLTTRLEELLAEGERIGRTIHNVTTPATEGFYPGTFVLGQSHEEFDYVACTEWRAKCITVLSQFVPPAGPNANIIEEFISCRFPDPGRFRHLFAHLRAAKDNFKNGFYDNLLLQIEAEVTCDYMGQAEGLLNEGQTGKFDHVPAAVLAGAVLEKTLRTLCAQQSPPVETLNSKGENKTLTPLIDDLKKAGLYNEARARQLRTWAGFRNHAAHGEFEEFNRQDVELMLTGIQNFLAEHMT